MNETEVLPALPVHALSSIHSRSPLPPSSTQDDLQNGGLARSASFPYLPQNAPDPPEIGLRRNFSENVLVLSPETPTTSAPVNKELFRRASRKAKKRLSEANVGRVEQNGPVTVEQSAHAENMDKPKSLSRTVSGTIRGLARRSWMPSSPKLPIAPQQDSSKLERKRSWSPNKSGSTLTIAIPDPVASRSSSRSSKRDENEETYPEVSRAQRQAPPLESTTLTKLLDVSRSESTPEFSRSPSSVSLSSKKSLDKIGFRTATKIPFPKSLSLDQLSVSSSESTRRRDPLWAVFRTLEGDVSSFQAKSSIYRTKIVRTSLLPFLAKYADHPSNQYLRAEDLDRRTHVLNKWWLALLDVVNGRNHQAVTATDRPALLEAISEIMMRPEWRIPSLSTGTGSDSTSKTTIPESKSSQSLHSSESEFLMESVHHNVRATFSQNLLSQMAFVVERLSMRTAPASLVAFCGKACAYAFFFCPGVADILVRLWKIPPSSLRRIFSELDNSRTFNFREAAPGIEHLFPPPIRSLCFSSSAALARHLRQDVAPPVGTAHIHWSGPWTRRWSGRESDLFFAFTKAFHLLVTKHIPSNVPNAARICAPGLIPVHAQILIVLEITLYRQAGQGRSNQSSSSSASKSEDPDSRIPILMTAANANRSMAENRLLMLLRDIVADTRPQYHMLRDLYVLSFNSILKASTRRISMYNNDACIVLCDFLDEFLPLISRYQLTNPDAFVLDWTFWQDVCQKMMQSHHTLTQVRLITFLYTVWNMLIAVEDQKRALILDWLLAQDSFESLFNHWCPMVRAYYHRLVCWRIARFDIEDSVGELDRQILHTLRDRIATQWAHYQYLKAEAEMRSTPILSSAPCTPAPTRRFLITRIDNQILPSTVITALDNFIPSPVTDPHSPYQSYSSALNTIPSADSPVQNRKRWSLFKNILPFNSTPGNSRPGEVTPPLSSEDSTFAWDPATSTTTAQPTLPLHGNALHSSTTHHRPLCFNFSLEWLEKASWPAENHHLLPPRLPGASYDLVGGVKALDARPRKPPPNLIAPAKYVGRALAEWELVVGECDTFFENRRQAGVPLTKLVETPALSVESFRMSGAG